MSEDVSTDNVMDGSQSDALMDLDYMDELLSEGFWLQKTDGSESLPQSPFSSSILFDPSLVWPALEEPEDGPSKGTEEDSQRVLSLENSNSIINGNGNGKGGSCALVQSKDCSAEASELSRRWWIGPTASTSAMDRLIRALCYIKDWSNDRDVLIQVWVPVNKGSERVLTTSHQPFSLGLNCAKLARYRDVSVNYQFPADEGSLEEFRGLPGRVFAGKVPEWTPDVQFFSKDEYPRVGHAQQHDVRGTFGVPIFEQGDHNCLGVIEVVFVTQKIKYRQELETVCKALEAVNLRSSSSSSSQNVKVYDYSYQTALPEITEMLRAVCGKHSLPLAQAWASCTRQEKEGSRHTNENLIHCVSTVDEACFIGDPCIQGFHEASSEHHLLKGQGIVGRALMTNQPCFSPDITSFTKTEYPLSHYARMFGLHAALAIPMQNTYAGSTDFVLELFLPTDCKEPEEHREMITSFYTIIQKVSRSLCAVTFRELQELIVPVVSKVGEKIPETEHIETMMASQDGLWHGSHEEVKKNVCIITSEGENQKLDKALARKSSQSRLSHLTIAASVHDDLITSGGCSSPSVGKIGEKKRAKAEKAVTLEILQQYFAGSLKDAAKSIGVCPTTLKRICRQHGIKRWPSRKIKKVGHSLKKIQRVIDSVQGASGALPVESFYSNFPELAFPRMQQFPSSDWIDPAAKALQPSDRNLTSHAAVSKSTSSSCSQNSTSSQSGPGGTEQHPLNVDDSGQQQLVIKEDSRNCLMKRIDSNSGLHEGPYLQPTSHTYFHEHPESNNIVPPVARETEQTLQSVSAYRLKVTYGEEKIRFRMQSHWGYGDVMREIGRRFGITDTSGFVIKYLDDDLEWVLLTCDDDLEECIDVYQSSGSQIIRLSFVRDSQ